MRLMKTSGEGCETATHCGSFCSASACIAKYSSTDMKPSLSTSARPNISCINAPRPSRLAYAFSERLHSCRNAQQPSRLAYADLTRLQGPCGSPICPPADAPATSLRHAQHIPDPPAHRCSCYVLSIRNPLTLRAHVTTGGRRRRGRVITSCSFRSDSSCC